MPSSGELTSSTLATSSAEAVSSTAAALLAARTGNREPALSAARKAFADGRSKLKADIKKASAFGRKIRGFTADMERNVLSDLETLSIGMFVAEAAQGVGPAVWEGKMRLTDVVPFVNCLSAIHQRYENFLPEALQTLQSGFAPQIALLLEECTNKLDLATGAIADVSRLRVAVRVMCELYLQGLVPTSRFFTGLLGKIVQTLDATASKASSSSSVQPHVTVNVLTIVSIILKAAGMELTHLGFVGAGGCALGFSESGAFSTGIEEEGRRAGADAVVAKTTAFSHIELIASKQREEALQRIVGRRAEPYATVMMAPEADRDQFTARVARITVSAAALCARLRREVGAKWRQLCEMTELTGEIAAEKRDAFAVLKRETERFIVLTENIAAMMGFPEAAPSSSSPTSAESSSTSESAPPADNAAQTVVARPTPIDLLAALRSSNADQSVVLVASSMAEFFTVRNAEAINHYDSAALRDLYENLPDADDLFALLPPAVPTRPVARPNGNNNNSINNTSAAGGEGSDYDGFEDDDAPADEGKRGEVEEPVPIMLVASSEAPTSSSSEQTAAATPATTGTSSSSSGTEKVVATYAAMEALIAQLYNLPTAEAADEWALAFITDSCRYFSRAVNPLAGALLYFNGCRRMLQRAVRSLAPCGSYETIPMVARVVASLSRRIEGLGDVVAKKVEGELLFAVTGKSSSSKGKATSAGPTSGGYMRKMRSVRYLCELVKFRVAPPLAAIRLFQSAVRAIDAPHAPDLLASLLSNVTSFLLRGGVTKIRAEEFLRELADVRVTRGAAIGSAQEALLDMAVSELRATMAADNNSSGGGSGGEGARLAAALRRRSPLEQYFRHLLFSALTEETLEEVCQSIRLMPWSMACEQGVDSSDSDAAAAIAENGAAPPPPLSAVASVGGERHYDMLIRVFRKTHQCRWDRLPALAEALADTCDVYPAVGAAVSDALMEDLRTDLSVASAAHHAALSETAISSIRAQCRRQIAAATEGAAAASAASSAGANQSSAASAQSSSSAVAGPTAAELTAAAAKAAATLTALDRFVAASEGFGTSNGHTSASASSAAPQQQQPSSSAVTSSLAKHLSTRGGGGAEASRGANALYAAAPAAARSAQKVLIDLKFAAELYHQRVLSFRAMGFILAQLCCFYPNADPLVAALASAASSSASTSSSSVSQLRGQLTASTSPLSRHSDGVSLLSEQQRLRLVTVPITTAGGPSSSSSVGATAPAAAIGGGVSANTALGLSGGARLFNYFVTNANPIDYSRIRYICGFLDCLLPHAAAAAEAANAAGHSSSSSSAAGPSPLPPLVAGERLVLERLLARLFLLIHSKARPFPMDLDFKIAETMQLASDVLYPYPKGYGHLRQAAATGAAVGSSASATASAAAASSQGGRSSATAATAANATCSSSSSYFASPTRLADVPEAQLANFQLYLDRAAERRIKRTHSKAEWRALASSARRALRREAQRAILKAADYSTVFPAQIAPAASARHASSSSSRSGGGRRRRGGGGGGGGDASSSSAAAAGTIVPYALIGRLLLETIAAHRKRGDATDVCVDIVATAAKEKKAATAASSTSSSSSFVVSSGGSSSASRSDAAADKGLSAAKGDVLAGDVGDEVREGFHLSRPFYFPRTRDEAIAHFDFIHTNPSPSSSSSGGGRGRRPAAAAPAAPTATTPLVAPGLTALMRIPAAPPQPPGHTLSKSRAKFYEETRLLAISAIPSAPLPAAVREAEWLNAVADALCAAATNGGHIYLVGGGGSSSAAGASSSASSAQQQQQRLDTSTDATKAKQQTATSAEGADDDADDDAAAAEEERANGYEDGESLGSDSDDDDDDDDEDSESYDDDDDDDDDGSTDESRSSTDDGTCDSSSSSSSDSSSDDDDDSAWDDRGVGSDDEEDYRGPAIGPQAFGLKSLGNAHTTSSSSSTALGASSASSPQSAAAFGAAGAYGQQTLRQAEEAEVDRLLMHMLLDSTKKALQRETVLDKRLEQRLSGGFYRSVAGRVLPANSGPSSPPPPAAAPPTLLKRRAGPTTTTPPTAEAAAAPQQPPTPAPTATTATAAGGAEAGGGGGEKPPAPTHTPFALIRRNNKGNAEARAFMVPSRSDFAMHVDSVIAEGQAERATAMKTTILLSRKQDEERGEEIRQKQLRDAAAALAASGGCGGGGGGGTGAAATRAALAAAAAAANSAHTKEDRIGSYRFSSGRK